jgi:hypothetical protein
MDVQIPLRGRQRYIVGGIDTSGALTWTTTAARSRRKTTRRRSVRIAAAIV